MILAYLLTILWSVVGTLIIIYMMASDIVYLLFIVASSCTVFLCHALLMFPTALSILFVHHKHGYVK